MAAHMMRSGAGMWTGAAGQVGGMEGGAGSGWGVPLTIRPLAATDKDACEAFLLGLSPASFQSRYFTPGVPTTALVAQQVGRVFARPATAGVTLVATVGQEAPRVVALAELVLEPRSPGSAEVALVVDDAWQRRGLGVALCRALVETTVGWGLQLIRAYTLPENYGLRRLVQRLGERLGYAVRSETVGGMTSMVIALDEQRFYAGSTA